ncbi:AsmA-like C-terminal region-containing protein, partial [Brevirhabdus pacifica]
TTNGPAFRIRSEDAGAVLAASGTFRTARGGNMELVLQPTGKKGTFDGTLKGGDIRVVNAPALASLLSAISVVGLLEQLGGNGIHFGDVEASFRLTPRSLVVNRGSAVGASMGISLEGVYDLASKRMDLAGVVSPVYLLNGLGQILTRNREGLFGFNYRLTGTAAAPVTSVNPLSILAPGFFRDIFRRKPPRPAE